MDRNSQNVIVTSDQYQVTVMSSEASLRCRMSGKYLLSPEKEDLCLRDLKTGQIVFSWPYRFLRRFGQVKVRSTSLAEVESSVTLADRWVLYMCMILLLSKLKEGITIETGRRCHTGEGHFTFLSKQGTQIYRAIEEAIMHQSVQDLLSNITSQMQDKAAQPPPPRPAADNRPAKASQGSPTRNVQNRPCPVVSRRNLALPPPPAPLAPPELLALPAPPAPLAVSPKRRPIAPRPPVSIPKAPPVRANPPPSSTGEVLYATIQPHPMPRSKPAAPKVPAVPAYTPTHHRPQGKQETEPKERISSASDEDPESDYCNWRQEAEASKGSPDLEDLYSKVVPLRNRRCNKEVSQDQGKPGQNAPLVDSEMQTNFKQMLSNILLKDLPRIPPPCPPRSYGGSSDQLAKLDMEMDDVDYTEIKI